MRRGRPPDGAGVQGPRAGYPVGPQCRATPLAPPARQCAGAAMIPAWTATTAATVRLGQLSLASTLET